MPINLPSSSPSGQVVEYDPPIHLVVIGANGSGKTRFGIWLEESNQGHMPVHRLSAQKALAIPEFASVLNVEQAEKDLFLGRRDQHASVGTKRRDRWGGTPANFMLSDYEKLLSLLFAKDAERDRIYTAKSRISGQFVEVMDSPIDQIVRLWAYLMPHRVISFDDGKVEVGKGSSSEYHAKEMSDGERVTLYLLGQCLCAPAGSLLIVDEPELHLHRSLMDKLWNKVEELCPDKSIVYITHDLDFAASRSRAKKIWIQSYSGSAWDWADVPEDAALPEALVLEIIGNRKPLLFCEGERGGLDSRIYQRCFPDHHVVPRGGSDKVIESTKAIQANAALHAFSASGIIDRDFRSDEEVSQLEGQGIHVLAYAEVENLLCAEVIVSAVAEKMSLDVAETVSKVAQFVIAALDAEMEAQIALRASRRIRYQLSCYSPTAPNIEGIRVGLDRLLGGLDVEALLDEAREIFNTARDSGRIGDILKVYNRKSISNRASSCFGMQQGEYPAMVLRLLYGANGEEFAARLRRELPTL